MIVDGKILVQGIDKDYFQDKFEIFHKHYKKITCVISFYPINSKYALSNIDRIDLSSLYNFKSIKNAYPINYSTYLDSKFLTEMNECQSVFFSTIDRCCSIPLPISYHRNYFLELLYFFKSFFENKKEIRNVFFSTTPHFPVDIILFYVAKYFSINIIILTRTDFNNQFFFRNDWRSIHFFNDNVIYNNNKLDFNVEKDSKFVQYAKILNKRSILNLHNNKLSRNIFIKYFYLIRQSFYVSRKKNLFSTFFLNNNISFISIIKLQFQRFTDNTKLYKHYLKISNKPIFSEEYIYFPLHFQPERSTDPEGLYFSNQLTALELLVNSIPKNIKIYVKEHPRQFDSGIPDLRKLYSRSKYFYNKILKMPNTHLIDIETDSNQLIINAFAVATISGSAGWEAILRGKHVLIFGRPWYSSCKTSHIINDNTDIIDTLKHIKTSNYEQNMEYTRSFINKIEGKTFDAFIGNVYFDGNKLSYKNLINSFANNLNKYLNSLNN